MAPSRQHSAGHSERWSGPSAWSIEQNKTAQWRQERVLKTASARWRKPQRTKPIEEPRWQLLKHWYSSSEVIANWNQQWVKTDEWEKRGGRKHHWSITSWLREHFKLGSIAASQSLTVDPSFSDYIWSLEAMPTDKRVLIPFYEISAKQIKGFIKCFDVNVQTWVIIIRADQVQGALKSQLQRHGSCLHRLDKGAKVSSRKGWWQTGERTKIKAQQ